MAGELGKASLDLEANVGPLERNLAAGRVSVDRMQAALDALAAVANVSERELGRVKLTPGQAAESAVSAQSILHGVRGISEEARQAARDLDRVRLDTAQAAETDLVGDLIDRKLKEILRQANETRRGLDRVKLAGARNGAGVGPFGSGFGRVGLLGTAIGAAAVTAPALAPGAVGLLASIPALAAGGAGALGTLALAFSGVGKAIGGDLQAYKRLQPAQQQFVLTVRSLDGWVGRLKQTAGKGLFPGLTAGLKSALSPGTTQAITKAVQEFASAIGQAGTMWGRYFGSKQFQHIFGPLMQAGAHNIGVLSQAFLSLFDALGVVGRAALPLVNWLTDLAAAGSKWVDQWLRAKDATGQLSGAMNEARSSLTLVGHLVGALFKAVFALGQALYPVAKVAVKDLTDGLDGLAKIIHDNEGVIRTLVGGALKLLVGAIKLTVGGLKLLTDGFSKVVGAKGPLITAILAVGVVLAATLGPEAVVVVGVIAAAGLIEENWKRMAVGLATIFGDMVGWIGKAFALIPKWIDPTLHNLGVSMEKWGFGLGNNVGNALGYGIGRGLLSNLKEVGKALDEWTAGKRKKAINDLAAQGFTSDLLTGKKLGPKKPKQTTWEQFMASMAAVPSVTAGAATDLGNPFGTPPPFDKNLGPKGRKTKAAVIPAAASHAEALASQNASKASVLHNVGTTAKRYLENELADLNAAAAIIKQKYQGAVGKARTELFNALTVVQNRIRTTREKIGKALVSDRLASLKLAVDQAANAAATAAKGSEAWKTAISAEAKALRNEIAYLDSRSKNLKLSTAKRDQALREELAAKKHLKQLTSELKVGAQDAAKNEQAFLQSYLQIVGDFGANYGTPTKQIGGATETHLYEIKHELRRQTPLLRKALDTGGPTDYALSSVTADLG